MSPQCRSLDGTRGAPRRAALRARPTMASRLSRRERSVRLHRDDGRHTITSPQQPAAPFTKIKPSLPRCLSPFTDAAGSFDATQPSWTFCCRSPDAGPVRVPAGSRVPPIRIAQVGQLLRFVGSRPPTAHTRRSAGCRGCDERRLACPGSHPRRVPASPRQAAPSTCQAPPRHATPSRGCSRPSRPRSATRQPAAASFMPRPARWSPSRR